MDDGHSRESLQVKVAIVAGNGEKQEQVDAINIQAADKDTEANTSSLLTTNIAGPPTVAFSAFSKGQKRWIIFMVAFASLISPLTANIYFPSLAALASDLHVSNSLINLSITTYMIFQGLAPTIFGGLADSVGRRPVYISTLTLYIGACIGLALQDSFAALLVLRCLQSSGSSGTIAIGFGVIADIATVGERGSYTGFTSSLAMSAPAIGPVIGGVLSQSLGWRSVFWFLTIMAGAFMVPLVVAFPETNRKVVGDGSIPPPVWNRTLLDLFKQRKQHEIKAVTKEKFKFPDTLATIKIILNKDVGIILFVFSIFYTSFYSVTASLPLLFGKIYHFNELQVGLCYLPLGVGCMAAAFITGSVMDRDYKSTALSLGLTIDKKRGDDLTKFPIEKARLKSIWWLISIMLVSTFGYGWALYVETNLAVPLILQFAIGVTCTGIFNILSTLLIDMYPSSPATATASANLTRCLMGAMGTAVIEFMTQRLNVGWTFTFWGVMSLAVCPLLLLERNYGMKWRQERESRRKAASTSV